MEEQGLLEISKWLLVVILLSITLSVTSKVDEWNKLDHIEDPENGEALHVFDRVVRFVSNLPHLSNQTNFLAVLRIETT